MNEMMSIGVMNTVKAMSSDSGRTRQLDTETASNNDFNSVDSSREESSFDSALRDSINDSREPFDSNPRGQEDTPDTSNDISSERSTDTSIDSSRDETCPTTQRNGEGLNTAGHDGKDGGTGKNESSETLTKDSDSSGKNLQGDAGQKLSSKEDASSDETAITEKPKEQNTKTDDESETTVFQDFTEDGSSAKNYADGEKAEESATETVVDLEETILNSPWQFVSKTITGKNPVSNEDFEKGDKSENTDSQELTDVVLQGETTKTTKKEEVFGSLDLNGSHTSVNWSYWLLDSFLASQHSTETHGVLSSNNGVQQDDLILAENLDTDNTTNITTASSSSFTSLTDAINSQNNIDEISKLASNEQVFVDETQELLGVPTASVEDNKDVVEDVKANIEDVKVAIEKTLKWLLENGQKNAELQEFKNEYIDASGNIPKDFPEKLIEILNSNGLSIEDIKSLVGTVLKGSEAAEKDFIAFLQKYGVINATNDTKGNQTDTVLDSIKTTQKAPGTPANVESANGLDVAKNIQKVVDNSLLKTNTEALLKDVELQNPNQQKITKTVNVSTDEQKSIAGEGDAVKDAIKKELKTSSTFDETELKDLIKKHGGKKTDIKDTTDFTKTTESKPYIDKNAQPKILNPNAQQNISYNSVLQSAKSSTNTDGQVLQQTQQATVTDTKSLEVVDESTTKDTSASTVKVHEEEALSKTNTKSNVQNAQKQEARFFKIKDHTFSVLKKGDRSIEVRLEPDGIGKLEIDINMEKGVLSAKINAIDPVGKEIIERNLQNILDALSKDGFNLGGFSVALKDKKGHMQNGNGQKNSPGNNSSNTTKTNGVEGVEQTRTIVSGDGKINIFV